MTSSSVERLIEIVREGTEEELFSFLSAETGAFEYEIDFESSRRALDYAAMKQFQSENEADEWLGSLAAKDTAFLNNALYKNHLLVLATLYGSLIGLKWLIQHGAEIQIRNKHGISILHFAARKNMKSETEAREMFEYLICEKGFSVDEIDASGWTPLHHACLLGNFFGVKYLVIHDACIEKRTNTGLTPFLISCESGYDSFLKAQFLVQSGANVRAVDETFRTAMHFAAKRQFALEDDKTSLFDLLSFECNLSLEETDKDDDQPVHLACKSGSFVAVKWMATHGAMINVKNKNGFTPFLNACQSYKDSLFKIQYLVAKGVNVNEKLEDGSSALHLVATKSFSSDAEAYDFCKYLIEECGLRTDEVDQYGHQPLHLANYLSCKALLEFGADIEARDYAGMTPFLTFAQRIQFYTSDAIGLLHERGCFVNAVSIRNQNALHCVAACQIKVSYPTFVLQVAKLLLSYGVDIESEDNNGNLPHNLAFGELKIFLNDAFERKRYARLYELGGKKADQCKVCLIGPPGAGKTTLVKSLKTSKKRDITPESEEDDSENPLERTAGIDITSANIESAGKVVFNDFAGQPDFYGTHGLFFSALTTIFLLVLNLSFDDLWTPASYWLSFVKCSVELRRRAHVILIGSRGEREDVKKLRILAERLRKGFREWFYIVEEVFGLDCRKPNQDRMRELRSCIGKVKEKCTNESREVPSAVDEIQTDFLFRLRSALLTANFDESSGPLPELIANNFFPEPLSAAFSGVSVQELRCVIDDSAWMLDCEEGRGLLGLVSSDPDFERELTSDERVIVFHKIDDFNRNCLLYNRVTLLKTVTDEYDISASELLTLDRHVFPARLFCFLMRHAFSPVMPDDLSELLLNFLNDIGEVIRIDNVVIYDPDWLCHTVIGPVLSPGNFLVHVDRVNDGVVTMDGIDTAIQAFCRFHRKPEVNILEAVRLLNRLRLCYPLSGGQDEFHIPALLTEDKRSQNWKHCESMEVYVGRRIQCYVDVDIISPAAFHLLQCQAGSNPSQQSVEFWRGGMVITKRKFISGVCHAVEALVEMQLNGRGIDIVARGGRRSEFECKAFVAEIRQSVSRALRERSPGTVTVEHFLSTTQIKKLSVKPMSYSLQNVESVKNETVTTKSSEGLVVFDSLRELLALPPHHVVLSGQEEIIEDGMEEILDNDTWRAVGRSLGIRGVRQMSEDGNPAKKFFDLWRERLDATLPKLGGALADAGRQDVISALIRDGVDLKISLSQLKGSEQPSISTTSRNADSADGDVSGRTGDDVTGRTSDDDWSWDPRKKQLHEARDYAKKIRAKGCSLREFHRSDILAEVIHGICTHASDHAVPIQTLLSVSSGDLSVKGKADTPYERLSQIIKVWIDKNTEPNLEELFVVIVKVGVWGTVGSHIKSTSL